MKMDRFLQAFSPSKKSLYGARDLTENHIPFILIYHGQEGSGLSMGAGET